MDDKEKNLINSENLNSQNNVGSFPLHNNTFVNSTDKSDINNRINNTKGRNLQNNMAQYSQRLEPNKNTY